LENNTYIRKQHIQWETTHILENDTYIGKHIEIRTNYANEV